MRICLFSSYYSDSKVPEYVKYYLSQLQKHFDRLVFLTNDDKIIAPEDLDWLNGCHIEVVSVRNEGYDFGMWQKALTVLDCDNIVRLALVNDSCILFAPLDDYFRWVDEEHIHVGGMTLSNENFPHVQSYFLVFTGPVVKLVRDYILSHPVAKMGYGDIVRTFELGLSRFLSEKKAFRIDARYKLPSLARQYNPVYVGAEQYINEGMPLIKKKLLEGAMTGTNIRKIICHGGHVDPKYYVNLIARKYCLSTDEVNRLFLQSIAFVRGKKIRFRLRVLKYRILRALGLLTDN